MEINKDNLKKVLKKFSKIPFFPDKLNRSVFFFPISQNLIKTDETFLLDNKLDSGSRSLIKPGIIITEEEGENYCILGYASIEYSKEFDLGLYLDIVDNGIKEKELEEILSYKCLLVSENSILGAYNFNSKRNQQKKEK